MRLQCPLDVPQRRDQARGGPALRRARPAGALPPDR
jgi:hypothetical protein